jgi:hypothetical protein
MHDGRLIRVAKPNGGAKAVAYIVTLLDSTKAMVHQPHFE